MTSLKTVFGAAVVLVPLALIGSPVSAQTTSVAVVDPSSAMLGVKAIGPAWKQISDQYRAAYTVAEARERTLDSQIAPLRKRLDTNNDGSVDQTELAAAQGASKPEIQQIQAAQQAAQADIGTTLQPARLAQAWVLDQVKLKFRPTLNAVAARKAIGLVVSAEAATFATPAADITDDVVAALDQATPTLNITPPAGWQPDQQTVTLFQQFNQALQYAAARAAQQQSAAPAPGTPATGKPTRDRNGDPIKK